MGTYGYISIIAMVCYGFMLLMFLTAKRNKIVNSFLVVLVGLLFGLEDRHLCVFICKYPAWGIPGMPECGGKEWASYFCV